MLVPKVISSREPCYVWPRVPVRKYDRPVKSHFRIIRPFQYVPPTGLTATKRRKIRHLASTTNMSSPAYRSDRATLLYKKIGQNIAVLRMNKGLTLKQLAAATGLSSFRLQKVQEGRLRLTPSVLMPICDYFGVSVDDIIYKDFTKSREGLS